MTAPALAAELSPIGEWLVKDGYAHIRIDNCGGKMWGIVAWEKTPGGIDNKNPDPAKKTRPSSACRSCSTWSRTEGAGQVDRRNLQLEERQDVRANISLADGTRSTSRAACVWPFCQTQNWTRVQTPPPNAPPLPPIKGATPPPAPQRPPRRAPRRRRARRACRVADEAAALESANAKK